MSPSPRRRLDLELVRRGIVDTRQRALAAIAAGRVLVAGAVADRPARLVAADEPVELQGPAPRFVGRGGEKLAAALDRFGLDVAGAVALDAGASTGGFTDCLLQRGASRVLAVDVGHGQLHPRLRADPRVVVLERTNVRYLTPEILAAAAAAAGGGGVTLPVDLVTADLSFISLTVVAPVLAGPVVRPGGELVVLVKPQFEAGRADVSRGRGVIRDPDVWFAALHSVASSLQATGAVIMDAMPSPLAGASGNTEFLLHASAHAAGPLAVGPAVDALLRATVAAAAPIDPGDAPADASAPGDASADVSAPGDGSASSDADETRDRSRRR